MNPFLPEFPVADRLFPLPTRPLLLQDHTANERHFGFSYNLKHEKDVENKTMT